MADGGEGRKNIVGSLGKTTTAPPYKSTRPAVCNSPNRQKMCHNKVIGWMTGEYSLLFFYFFGISLTADKPQL